MVATDNSLETNTINKRSQNAVLDFVSQIVNNFSLTKGKNPFRSLGPTKNTAKHDPYWQK